MTHVAETTISDKGSLLASWLGEVVVYDVKNGEIRYRVRFKSFDPCFFLEELYFNFEL